MEKDKKMFSGGFYSVDAGLICREVREERFDLRLDTEGCYGRRVYTNNGRTASIYALRQAAEQMEGKKLLLPDYLCVSILTAVEYTGIPYSFYRVSRKLEIDVEDLKEKLTDDIGMVYVIHYFSVPQPEEAVAEIRKLAADRGLLIFEDVTQALFSRGSGRMGFGDFVAASIRKWFPMTDGGIAAVRDSFPAREIPLMAPYNEAAYKELLISVVRTYFESNPGLPREGYLKFEKEANASRYVDLEIRGMTEASRRVFFNSDKEELIRRRCENYTCLYEGLQDCGGVELFGPPVLGEDCVPFGLVLLVGNREEAYRLLTGHNIIPEIQWVLPTDRYEPGPDARYLSEHNLMLQCDQRYTAEDMRRTAATVRELLSQSRAV